MHSEVFVRFAEGIRIEWLTAGLPPGSHPSDVLAKTHLRGSPDLAKAAVYACAEPTFGYIVFQADRRSVRVHVEGRTKKGELRNLVRESERIADAFISEGKSHGARLERATITLYAEESLITTGTHQTFGHRLMQRFAETIFGDVVVGLFTCVLTGVLTREWDAAVVVGFASVLCFLMWVAIEIRGERDAYEYADL